MSIIERSIGVCELVRDRSITKQQEASADDPEEKYQATQNLDRICNEYLRMNQVIQL